MNLNKQILEAIQRGINLAIDDFDDNDIEIQKVGQIENKFSTIEQLELRKRFVDLGLPSGTWWGRYNIGVDPNKLKKAEDWFGGYYSWGEIEEKQEYVWETYKYTNGEYTLTKYCDDPDYLELDKNSKLDNLTTLQDEDDVAVQNNKLPWNVKMPTKKQFDELLEYTTSEWVANYQGIIRLNGRIFTSKTNGNQMFVPAAEYRVGASINDLGTSCRMWSRSLYQTMPYSAYCLYFYSSDCYLSAGNRYLGFSARPVLVQ